MLTGVLCSKEGHVPYTTRNNELILESGAYKFDKIISPPAQFEAANVIVFGQMGSGAQEHGVQLRKLDNREIIEVASDADTKNWFYMSRVLHAMATGKAYVPYNDCELTRVVYQMLLKAQFSGASTLQVLIYLPMDASSLQQRQLELASCFAKLATSTAASGELVQVSLENFDSLKSATLQKFDEFSARLETEFRARIELRQNQLRQLEQESQEQTLARLACARKRLFEIERDISNAETVITAMTQCEEPDRPMTSWEKELADVHERSARKLLDLARAADKALQASNQGDVV